MVQFNATGAKDFGIIVVISFIIAVMISWLPLAMGNVIIDTFNAGITLSWQTVTFVVWVVIGAYWTITD